MSVTVQNSSKKTYQNNENRRLTSQILFILNVLLRETGHSDTQKITFQALFTYLYRSPDQFLPLSYDFLRLQLIRLDKRIKEADLPELPSNRLIKDRLTSLFDLHLSIGLSFFEERSQLNGVPRLRLFPHIDNILDLAYQNPNFDKSPYKILEQVACQYAQDLLKNAKPIPKEEIDEKKRKSLDEYIDSLIDQFLSSSSDSEQYLEAESSLSKLRTNFQLAINQSQKAIERNQKRLDQIAQARYSDSVARHYSFINCSPSSDSQKRRNTGGGISNSSTNGRSEILSKNSPNSMENRSEIFDENSLQNERKTDSSVEAVPYGRPYSENIRVSSEVIEKNVSYSDKKNDVLEKSPKSTPMTIPQKLTENTFQKEAQKMVEVFEKIGVKKFQVSLYKPIGYLENGKEDKRAEDTLNPSPQELKKILPNLEEVNCSGLNLGIHPVLPEGSSFKLILLDDLTREFYEKLKKFGFWGQQTSENSFHLWVAIEGTTDKQYQSIKKRLKQTYGGDSTASYSKICFSLNWKLKYGTNPPRIQQMDVGGEAYVTNEAELVGEGIIGIEEKSVLNPPPCVSLKENGKGKGKAWPDYRISLAGAPLKEDGTPDRSVADFRWGLYAAKKMGCTDENELARKLMEVSERAKESGWDYALKTMEKAFR